MARVGFLATGGDADHLLPRLLAEINQATEIEFAVSFIKSSGLNLLLDALKDAVELRAISLKILTSDYLDVTDPQALRMLMLLQERGANIRIFHSDRHSFHLKSYIFLRSEGVEWIHGSAYVGSSNISRPALTDGIEWNYNIIFPDQGVNAGRERFEELRIRFAQLFAAPETVELSYPWIEQYEQRRKVVRLPVSPGSDDPELPAPTPQGVQVEALQALAQTRAEGYQRGLVVLATGLGKTFLAAFDAQAMKARRVLFVAHREEILLQAEGTFLRIWPKARVGFYTGNSKDRDVDLLFASVQTLGQAQHLNRFPIDQFDYIVIDEFHHAAASTYQNLLRHFQARFLLGLTATPERTDQSDILSLCDDNLVYTSDLFAGISQQLLCPFTYYGIYDEQVDYSEIPWRSGKFDPAHLANKLATLARARHALKEWQAKAGRRTLAFCVSIIHAEFMAKRFTDWGIKAAAVHAKSELRRSEALHRLDSGDLEIIFSVDLFNEGVDLPSIDTVMMLRPTESKILFLQQLGRGLRRHPDKERLLVLDFIGNHKGFLNKPQALFKVASSHAALAEFAIKAESGNLLLPEGCFVNYDLAVIEFLKQLNSEGLHSDYEALRDSLGRRPTLTEFYHSGVSINKLRQQYGSWWEMLERLGELNDDERGCLARHKAWLREVETTAMTKCFKMVLLEALVESEGFHSPPTLEQLAEYSLRIFQRRRPLVSDLQVSVRDVDNPNPKTWFDYWRKNPISAWLGENRPTTAKHWFKNRNNRFTPAFQVSAEELDVFTGQLRELISFRLAKYSVRPSSQAVPIPAQSVPGKPSGTELAYFEDLKIACGHFRTSSSESDTYVTLGSGHGNLNPARHFIARASGNSMNGGKHPIRDGDYLLLEQLSPTQAGSITGATMAIERQDEAGDNQYLLRVVTKTADGRYVLKANNPDYADMTADETMRTFARLKEVLSPLDIASGQLFMREEIPALFGQEFNRGNWQSGHVVINDIGVHVLLVTLNKQGKEKEHQYHDYFIDETHFHWQSQNSTSPDGKRGLELIEHQKRGIRVYLFIREYKLERGKAAPFKCYGKVNYLKHEGSKPMSIVWQLL